MTSDNILYFLINDYKYKAGYKKVGYANKKKNKNKAVSYELDINTINKIEQISQKLNIYKKDVIKNAIDNLDEAIFKNKIISNDDKIQKEFELIKKDIEKIKTASKAHYSSHFYKEGIETTKNTKSKLKILIDDLNDKIGDNINILYNDYHKFYNSSEKTEYIKLTKKDLKVFIYTYFEKYL
ncbi:hypothetical protein MTBBW1_2470002 [Desulfamplus magnetovallimortis]|uniref:Uncharacterized protein n=1 Tax=Desulfamplus magnetovallimortis TaxID=1246637 RepID=A0A1W1HEK7_9BACT|nr:hypothetical protein [Desulfamplus magnetovallimortis]SLM30815.1 hypothetical protein MTBBW1_2470002 [Desulfamplus magnetovallimortis]